MHKFELSISNIPHIGLDAFNYGVKAALLIFFAILFVLWIKKKMKQPLYISLEHKGVWHSINNTPGVIGVSLGFALMAWFLTAFFMAIIISLYEGELICVVYIAPRIMEFLVLFVAIFLAASKSIKNRFFQVIKYPLLILLVIIASSSFFLSLKRILLNKIYGF